MAKTAADIVNRWSERDIADLLFQMADERGSRRIARRIVERRAAAPIRTTKELAELVYSAIGGPSARDKIDPATRTFMALRMAVNAETENLEHLLEIAPKRLRVGGRVGVISFHSTEDRLVKLAFRTAEQVSFGKAVTRKPVVPTELEMDRNPRSRSAKFRVLDAHLMNRDRPDREAMQQNKAAGVRCRLKLLASAFAAEKKLRESRSSTYVSALPGVRDDPEMAHVRKSVQRQGGA